MSENKKQEATSEELKDEQLEGVAGGYNPVDGIVGTPKPILPLLPVDGNV